MRFINWKQICNATAYTAALALVAWTAPGAQAPQDSGAANTTPVGVWKTVDDKTRQPRGLVRIFERNGELVAVVETSFNPKELDDVCDKCTDERKNQKVIGMEIVRGMRKKGSEYSGGEILDPDTGSIYKCRMVLEDGGRRLVVRGFIGISMLGRSQVWYREK
jgi:uncharacterized protein (DUF2147 family)